MLPSEGSDVRLVAPERVMSMLQSEGSVVRIVAFPVDLGVSSEDPAQTAGDFLCVVMKLMKEDIISFV